MTCERHPNSDHLSLTTVDIGSGVALNIVCGASNVAAGQKVVVATIGTTLYFNDKELTLQKTKIRGALSEGMICAEDELGIGNSHDGILVLPPDTPVGIPAKDFFGIEEDVVFTIGLTPNRVDAASHLGVARDLVAVYNNYGVDDPVITHEGKVVFPDLHDALFIPEKPQCKITVEDTSACPRYTGLVISGVKVGESPDWLRHRLMAAGLRPINNIVDITNFVLLETGQPLHAFDYGKIAGGHVIVKKFPEVTPFTTLDGIERKLSAHDLMIANESGPMCIAGVFGGLESGVSGETHEIFLESACFDPVHVRRTSRHHGLQTDASFRFERGSNIDVTVDAIKRTASLILEIAGGEIVTSITDVYPKPGEHQKVELSYVNLRRLVGKTLHPAVVISILTDLGFKILSGDISTDTLLLDVPAAKVDVTREADVIEEILRIYGYNNIEFPEAVLSSLSHSLQPDPEHSQQVVTELLVSNGFFETMNNSLTKSLYYQNNTLFPDNLLVRLLNPISRDLDVMRQTLLYGALESLSYNINRKISDLKMFEFGRVYRLSDSSDEPLQGYHEEAHLSLLVTGRSKPENWNHPEGNTDLFYMRGVIEAFFTRLGVPFRLWTQKVFSNELFSQGLLMTDRNAHIGMVGVLSGTVLKSFDLKQPVFYAELNWTYLLTKIPSAPVTFSGVPRFPEVRRDLALVVDQSVTFAQLEELAGNAERKLLRRIGLFDVYEGEKVGNGKKSYAMSFILRDDNKTLTDQEIEKCMSRLLKAFSEKFDARLR
jgi:phenylalanyl-tRNA synthetase beta chain